jgi:hypothetical protein
LKMQIWQLKRLTKMLLSIFKVNCWIPRLPNLPSHWFQNKKVIIVPKLFLQSPRILKQNNSLSYKP